MTFQFLGIVPSFSRSRVSDDNPYPEALFRTLKYRPEYPGRPDSGAGVGAAIRAMVQQLSPSQRDQVRQPGGTLRRARGADTVSAQGALRAGAPPAAESVVQGDAELSCCRAGGAQSVERQREGGGVGIGVGNQF